MAPGDPCALRRKAFHILWIVQIESGTETRERDLAFCETGGSAAGERSDRGLNNDDDPVQMFSLSLVVFHRSRTHYFTLCWLAFNGCEIRMPSRMVEARSFLLRWRTAKRVVSPCLCQLGL